MSIDYNEEDFDSNESEGEQDANDIKSLRRAANSKKQLEKELADARRELAFAKAGISLDDPKMKYFVKGYDGELTASAVKAAATEAGFLTNAPSQSEIQEVTREVSEAQSRVSQASFGAIQDDTGEASALMRMQEAMNEGGMEAMMDVARQYGIPVGSEM